MAGLHTKRGSKPSRDLVRAARFFELVRADVEGD